MPSSTEDSITHPALELVNNDRMHRELTLPANATHEALNVSYADVGQLPVSSSDDGAVVDQPTVLLIPGMFGSRFLALRLHAVAEKLGVRVLIVDRYAMTSPLL